MARAGVRAAARPPAHVRACSCPSRAGVGAAAPLVLRVGDRAARTATVAAGALHDAATARCSSAAVAVALGRGRRRAARESRARSREPRGSARAQGALAAGGARDAGRGPRGWPGRWPATRVTRVEHGWHSFKGGYGAEQPERQPAGERAGQQPLRLLPRGARRIRRPPAGWASAPTTMPAAVPAATGAATRRRTTRTASSCARSRRPGLLGGAARARSAWAAPLLAGAARARARARDAARRRPRSRPPRRRSGFGYWARARLVRLVLGVRRPRRARRSRCSGWPARSRPSSGWRRSRAERGGARRRAQHAARCCARDGWPLARGRVCRRARRGGLARGALAEPAAGAERGAHLADGAGQRPTRA